MRKTSVRAGSDVLHVQDFKTCAVWQPNARSIDRGAAPCKPSLRARAAGPRSTTDKRCAGGPWSASRQPVGALVVAQDGPEPPRSPLRSVELAAAFCSVRGMDTASASSAKKWTLLAVCLTTFMLLLDITVVVVALPNMQERFDASLTGLQWVVDAYALSLAALILTAGALADRYGRRLIFMAGVLLFTFSSLLCGLAWNITTLDVARALQGIGGAALFATALAIIGHEYRGHELFGALAVWGATVGAAVASGPLIGGLLTDGLGWRWIFFVNIPVGVFAFAVALTRISESRDEGARHTDVSGLVTFSAALFLIVFGILRGNTSGWTSPAILLSLVGGVLVLVVFVAIELRQERPMFDVRLFRQPAFVGISVATFCIAAGMFAIFPYLSIYLQDILGYSPLATGLRFLPLTGFVFLVPLVTRRRPRACPSG